MDFPPNSFKIKRTWDFEAYSVDLHSAEASDGRSMHFNVLNCPDWVNVLAVTASSEIVLVRQYRHALQRHTLELPGGLVEGADLLKAGQEELKEETGFGGGQWFFLGKYLANAGLQNNHVHSFFCLGATALNREGLDESTSVQLLPLLKFWDALYTGELAQAFALATAHLAIERGLLAKPQGL